MIPSIAGFQDADFEIAEQPSYTFRMNKDKENISGYTDELEAVKQAVYKILLTERYEYIMYSGNYGIELADLFGQSISYVCPELERRITEALVWDDRIESVSDFEFDVQKRGAVHAAFTVHTVFGDIRAQREVNI